MKKEIFKIFVHVSEIYTFLSIFPFFFFLALFFFLFLKESSGCCFPYGQVT